jgi:hypothetical protein
VDVTGDDETFSCGDDGDPVVADAVVVDVRSLGRHKTAGFNLTTPGPVQRIPGTAMRGGTPAAHSQYRATHNHKCDLHSRDVPRCMFAPS